jgi:predicted unusual protein kinase regulating ubiquinone biosynthesis (AarF/ABC1/UbiB family)
MLGLAARTAVGRVGASLRRRLGDDDALVEFHERNAMRYAEALSGAKGLLMKVGQLMSFVQPGGQPGAEHWSPYQDALASLRTAAEPMHPDLVRAVIEAELGAPPEGVFKEFDPRPLAAASIGQVHRAQLPDGHDVAVKVQYPGVAEAIESDLANTELLTTLFKLAQNSVPRMPRINARALADELRERIGEELNYSRERANLDDFAAIYAGDPAIRIPATHPRYCTRRVLTMDLVEGHDWEAAKRAPQHLRNKWGETIDRFFFQSIYRHGIFHADPHPGNYVFHDSGNVTFLDFGCVSRLDPESLEGFVEIAGAAVDGDAPRLAAVFHRLGFVEAGGPSAEELLAFYRPTFESLIAPQPFRMTTAFAASVLDLLSPIGPKGTVGRQFNLPPPFLLTMRIYIGLFSVLAALEAEADWRAIYDEDVRYYDITKRPRPQPA